jgi:5-methylcytosine-specific restriction endonuclease McrA
VLGSKEELKAIVEMQLPNEAAAYAKMHESILSLQKTTKSTHGRIPFQKADSSLNSVPVGDIWKARQLKEYRRDSGLCFGCSEIFVPRYAYVFQATSFYCE